MVISIVIHYTFCLDVYVYHLISGCYIGCALVGRKGGINGISERLSNRNDHLRP